jgi:multiple antibiotic resistance protein
VQEAVSAFLLGFPALFSIVNPVSGALIFQEVTGSRWHTQRVRMARMVALNSLAVMMVALWAGPLVLGFFGISLAALRVAGGIVVALTGWDLLNAPEATEERKAEQASQASGSDTVAMFPLTIPITTGPGTISVAIALGAGHPRSYVAMGWFFLGMTAAVIAMAATIWVFYAGAEQVTNRMGANGRRTITRLAAFLLLCIGVQILIRGVADVIDGRISPL